MGKLLFQDRRIVATERIQTLNWCETAAFMQCKLHHEDAIHASAIAVESTFGFR